MKNIFIGVVIGIVIGVIGGYIAGKHLASLECIKQLNTVTDTCLSLVDEASKQSGIDNESKIRSECSKLAIKTGAEPKNSTTLNRQQSIINMVYKSCLTSKGMKPEDML